jgi:hypothetical protein
LGGLAVALATVKEEKKAVQWEEPLAAREQIGDLSFEPVGPKGLIRLDGLEPSADAFIYSLRERFKLRVVAVYGVEKDWRQFVTAAKEGKPCSVPRLAVLSLPLRMEGRQYDKSRVSKELKRYKNLVSLATNTRPITAILAVKANSKLKDKLGIDLGFRYRAVEYPGRFNDTPASVSYAVLIMLNLFGQKTEGYATITALNVADKFIYLTWLEPSRGPQVASEVKSATLLWIAQTLKKNPALASEIELTETDSP